MYQIKMPDIDDYQRGLLENVNRVIENNFYSRLPTLRLLDNGCDTSGKQLRYLSQLTQGEVVGINIREGFPSKHVTDVAGGRVTCLNMNGMDLKFPDQSFDMVISANVMEHVSDPVKYINECCRVLKDSGIAYFETAPIWTSARGHHIHEDMIAENCPEEGNYRNDGSVIPDWAHLKLSENELRTVLENKLEPKTCDYILSYLYHSTDLNKIGWNAIRNTFNSTFTEAKISTWYAEGVDQSLKPKRNQEDFGVYGFNALARRKKQNGISRRLIWRLRRMGL